MAIDINAITESELKKLEAEYGKKILPDKAAMPEGESGDEDETNDESIVTDQVTPRIEAHPAMQRPMPGLYNATAPACDLKKEKYNHRLIAILKSTGLSNTEIADMVNMTPPAVGYIVKQPWMQQLILERIHGTGDKAMLALHAAAEEAAARLIDIAKTADNMETRRKANIDILDRKYGRPNQPYTVSTKSADELSDAELAKHLQTN